MKLNWLAIGFKIAPILIGAIHAVEKFIKGIKGREKQDAALAFAKEVLELAEGATGKELLDDARMQDAMRKLIDAYVAVQNMAASIAAERAAAQPPAA
jgi:hypothetical protein